MLKKEKSKSAKEIGITLIALVITIIVLLILAGISMAMLTGNNGILTKATTAKEKTKEAQIRESVELMVQDYNIGKHTGEDENIKEYFQNQASKGEISSIRENKDNTYTINDDGNVNYAWVVSSDWNLRKGVVDSNGGVRPVINLSADVSFSGSGTATDPYVVS